MLTKEYIQQTVSAYFIDKPVKKVYLFGSYATGEANEKSDVDLSLVLNEDEQITYVTLAGYLIDLEKKLKNKIDIVEEKMIYRQFRPSIDQSKILIYDR